MVNTSDAVVERYSSDPDGRETVCHGVALRTARVAVRHSPLDVTMNICTDRVLSARR